MQSEQTRRDIPLQQREAQIIPDTFNDGENTVDVVWTAGARVRRFDFWNDRQYEEELDVTESSVDMSRFEAGAVQVLDNHDQFSGVRAILGIAQRGWIEGGEGKATLRLSTDPAKAGVVGDIKAGIIRTISVGYTVAQYEVTRAQDRKDGGKVDLYRATNWSPKELSFVTVPADAAAGTRAEPKGATFPCEFIQSRISPVTQGASMEVSTATGQTTAATEQPSADAIRAEAAQAERQRASDITDLCTRASVPELALGLIRDSKTLDQARAAIIDERVRQDAAAGGQRNVRGISTVQDETQTRMDGIGEALMHRIDPKAALTDNGKQYRGLSLLEMGREHMERSGVSTRGWDRMRTATEILHFRSGSLSTSDFANLLQNVATKRLRQGYEENMPSYQRWARRAPDAPDFKSMSVVNLAGAPDLLQVNEHGEFKYGAMTDGKETYSLTTYGRIVSLTRQAIVNDDLRGFDRLVGAFGNSAARLENRTVYAILTANANMADGGALFNATAVTTTGGHANYTSSGTAISVASLTIGRKQMRAQKGLQSEELNIAPRFLIVPAALEQIAYQFTSPNYVPATAATINEFRAGGRTALEPVVEAVLDATSATAWYLLADNAQVDTVEYCYLQGAAGPVIESEVGFDVDGVSYKCRLDFAAKAIDWRGGYLNAGA